MSEIGPSYWRTSCDVIMMSQQNQGRSNRSLKWVNFLWVLSRLILHRPSCFSLLRYQLVRRYRVSKTSVLFRYHLWVSADVLNWSVSLRYQLVRHCNVSNWSVVFTYQWDVAKTSKVGPSHWRPSCNVMMTSQHGPRRTDFDET